MRILTVVICIVIICSSTANIFFSLSNNEVVLDPVMTIADVSDEVFVVGGNIIYKLSANLSQLMNVTISNDASVSVRGLSVSNGGQCIVACLTTGSCIGYDVINLNSTSSVALNEPTEVPLSGDDPVAIFPGAAEGIVYTGTATDTDQTYRMSLGRYRISSGSIMAVTTRDYSLQRSRDFNTRIFKAGFSVDNFTYYIVEDDSAEIRILRVCNESTNSRFEALYEVHLVCGQSTLFAGASLYENFPNSTDNTLLLLVQPPAGQVGSSRLCTYQISDINSAIEAGRTACANNNERAAVWDDNFPSASFICSLDICTLDALNFDLEAIRGDDLTAELLENMASMGNIFTSSVIVQVEGELLIFIGTENGVLLKYIFVNQNFSNSELYNTTTITDGSIISLQWLLGSNYVYGLTSRQVIAVLVEDCQSLRDCTSCTGLGDPLCGWCSIENKCSRKSECSANNETRRWIQDQTMCIVNFAISPNTLSVNMNNQQFSITADQLSPPLDDESYYCMFGDVGSSLLEGNLNPGVAFTNLTCDYSFIVEKFSNGSDDTAVVDFSLRSNLTNVNFITIDDGFRFFNCSTHTSCCSCLSSTNLCGWCLYEKKCTSSSDQCKVSTDWINTDNNNNESCPLILSRTSSNGVSEYRLPVGVTRNLSLSAINLPAPNENYTYQCVVSYNGLTSRIEAAYTRPNGLVCIAGVDDFTQVDYVNNASVSVLWTGPNVTYYLKSEVDPLTLILYNCSALAGVCSSCLSVSNLLSLDCGWCHDSRSCVVTESCSTSSNFTATSGNTCPLPQITMVNPNSGPYQGGTDVTITGTDLGVVFEDIIDITIGGALCIMYNDSYIPGVGFRCKTSAVSSSISISDVSITVNRSGSTETVVMTNGFRYAVITISDFNPRRIPQSGNIIISIFGSNFDVSDPTLAVIRLVEVLCNITNREILNSTFVQCIAGPRETRASGPVTFSIDNGFAESEGDLVYTDDPQVFSLRNNKMIESGGIKLIFTGRDLDVVSAVLIIDIMDNTTNSTVLAMPYDISCTAETDRDLSCTFPAIPLNLLDGVINGTLQLAYSLVAASVPGLVNLHLMSQFVIEFVDDPVITPINETLIYQVGSNAAIVITGTGFDVFDQSEVIIRIGETGTCNIISYSSNAISCLPPQSGVGTLYIMAYVGEYLNYTVGGLQYLSDMSMDTTATTVPTPTIDASTSTEIITNTTIVIAVVIATVLVLIIILSIIGLICVVRKKKSKKHTVAVSFTGNTDVSMYSSPAYGTHQVFTEPGLDHLYEPIDEYYGEKSTTLQDAPTTDDDETDVDGYLKMNPSFEVVDQAITESAVADNESTIMENKPHDDDDYVQAVDDKIDDHLPTVNNDQKRMNIQ